ncbi:hypothetical protein SPI_04241 [Niveomyces insectorum RCEF 264]|uniref:Uncharacterized protein n=1 Tax=Niveomyces insectorum RCEF 264 TaxID=1081102 RepID=A0A167VJT7_9HYPO|nr:hypothetical protein SPI_04241 [Niveomyces insectorum RCEF 264]
MATVPSDPPQRPLPPTICRPASPAPDALSASASAAAAAKDTQDGGHDLPHYLLTASSLSNGTAAAAVDASSSLSLGFAPRDARDPRDWLGSDVSSSNVSRQSSGSYSVASSASAASSPTSRLSMASTITTASISNNNTGSQHHATKRRGYMRPQGTDFAASARSRESVLSLGSITHLQHYFARTGLLDLKGQLERRRRDKARTLDLSLLEGSLPGTTSRPRSMVFQSTADAGANTSTGDSSNQTLAPEKRLSYMSTGSSPDFSAQVGGMLVESPVDDQADHDNDDDDDWYAGELDETDPAALLPPTVSTYMYREKPLPKPPSIAELRADLKASLDKAAKALSQAREFKEIQAATAAATESHNSPSTTSSSSSSSPSPKRPPAQSPATATGSPNSAKAAAAAGTWYEIQGMHILDVLTLAIRAAKVYYTSHEHPDRLDAIKSEREVRSELLSVMDVLKRMATRNFAGGVRSDEIRAMEAWIDSLYAMLAAEDAIVAAERAERAGWTWLRDGDWPADPSVNRLRAYAREHAFLQSMLARGTAAVSGAVAGSPDESRAAAAVLPPWTPMDRSGLAEVATTTTTTTTTDGSASSASAPTPFLQHMQNGVCLVQLHNCAVRASRRRFGAIPSFHADTQKPYRAADNLRYWAKAAELRWEVLLAIDPLGVVCNSRPEVWPAFEDAIYRWCRKVREEIAAEVDQADVVAGAS